uniref:Fatty acid-binding protein, muscle n=1 Tax=Schizaphis graminum TaxID=13262 RepID=A0A2S2PQQ6_SCHGA
MALILNKKYKLDSSENFDDYMKALGVGMVKRTLGNTATPVVELTKNADGKFVLSSNSTMKNSSIVFNLDEEFIEETLDGRKVKSIISQDGNKLIHVQKYDKHSDTTIVRVFEPDQLKMVLTIDGITCTRIYKPID